MFVEEENSVSNLDDISPSKRGVIKLKRKRDQSSSKDMKALKDVENPSEDQDLSLKNEQVRPNLIARLNTKRMRTRSGRGGRDHIILKQGSTAESNNNIKEKSNSSSLPPKPPHKSPGSSLEPLVTDVLGDSTSTSIAQFDAGPGDPPTLSDREEELADIFGIIEDNEVKELPSSSVLLPSVEKSSIEDSFDLRRTDLPVIYNFEVFEEEVYQDIKVFDQIEEIEKHDHSMVEIKLPTPCRKQKKQGGGKVLYECKICSKVFMQLSEFTEHEEKHQRDIICDICGKIQRSASHLLNHRTHHHPNHREKPCEGCRKVPCQCEKGGTVTVTPSGKIKSFCCRSCGSVFDSKSLLVRHQIVQHNMHKISKKTGGNFKHIEWRKKAQKDLSRALLSSKKFRSL